MRNFREGVHLVVKKLFYVLLAFCTGGNSLQRMAWYFMLDGLDPQED